MILCNGQQQPLPFQMRVPFGVSLPQKTALLHNSVCAFSAAVSIYFYVDFVLLCLGSSCSGSKLARILLHINGLCLPANLVCNFHAHNTHANTYDEAKRNEKQPWKAFNMSWFLSSVVRNLFVHRLRNRTKFCTIFRSVCTEHHCLCWVTYIKGNCFDLFSIWSLLCVFVASTYVYSYTLTHAWCVRRMQPFWRVFALLNEFSKTTASALFLPTSIRTRQCTHNYHGTKFKTLRINCNDIM